MFKKSFFLFLATLFFLTNPIISLADDCDPSKCGSEDTGCLEQVQTACTQKLSELGTAKNTLANQIKILNSQYDLTLLKITQTENSIKILDKEINDLTIKINDLDQKLNQLASIYVLEIIENYKLQKKVPPYAFLLTSKLNTFLEQYKYAANVQKASQNSMINMQTIKTDYDTQKAQKAEKQQAMETLQKTLDTQKTTLTNQKAAKDRLLETTKNDEKKYQSLLAEAQSQLAALKSFSSTYGNSCLSSSPSTGNDGNFYSQRDPRWCNQYIGSSKDTIGEVGCYISSICMTYKKLGSDISPSSYAANSSNFWSNTAYMLTPSPPSGYSYKQVSYSASKIDDELKAGRYVIAQMKMNTGVGMHFITIISGSNGNYKIHDPWFGSDQDFSSRYSTILIMSLRLITK